MEIFIDTDKIFFMIGAGFACICPLSAVIGGIAIAVSKWKVVDRDAVVITEKEPYDY